MAKASLPKSVYPEESLAVAAIVLGRRARIELSAKGKRWLIAVGANSSAASPDALLGEFLNEALSHARRQARLKKFKPFVSIIAGRLLSKGFLAVPADPLEQLEPQVRFDRNQEIEALISAAGKRT